MERRHILFHDTIDHRLHGSCEHMHTISCLLGISCALRGISTKLPVLLQANQTAAMTAADSAAHEAQGEAKQQEGPKPLFVFPQVSISI